MELKASSRKPGDLSSVDCIPDPEDKEISDDDDDRNHKHRRRDIQAQSTERDQLEQGLTRSYRKYNKTFQNGNLFREVAPHSQYKFDPKFDKRCPMTNYSQGSSDLYMRFKLNQSTPVESGHIRGRGRDISWYQCDSRFSSMDVSPVMAEPGLIPSAMLVSTGLASVSNPQSSSWNSIGFIPGIPNGAIDAIYPLGWQGPLRPTLNPSMNIGIPRQHCRDFEERGFCLRGDMCPMEHGVNRIVVEDVQSLSQFNLSVSLPSAPLMGTSVGAGLVPPVPAASSSLINRKSSHRINKHQKDEDMHYLDCVPGPADSSGTDVYDPDQPLWNNDCPDPSNLLLAMHQPRINDSESLMEPAQKQLIQNNSAVTGSQNSVWGRICTSKSKLDVKEKVDSRINSSSLTVSKMQETQVEVRSAKGAILLGKQINSEPVQRAGDSSSKAQDDIGQYVRKRSQKAQRTLFVNFIPLKENKREALLAHFRKFGQVIDIYIPPNTEQAFIQFSKREEAEAALRAPDAVMSNRFIRMWWANRDSIPDKSISTGSTSTILAQDVSVFPYSTISKGKNILSVSIPKVSVTQAADSPVTPINDSKVLVNGPKSSSPALQKTLHSLELLEEIRRKQEQLDQKRNEFRLQLNKLEKQSTGIKGEVHAEHASKRLRVGITAPTVKSENSRFSEPVGSGDAFIAHESVLKLQTGEKNMSSSGQMDLPLALPDSSNSKEANCALPTLEIEDSGTKNQLDIGLTTFTVNAPLPFGLADVDALRGHFSSFGELSNVDLEYMKAEDAENSSCDPELVDNCRALVSFRSHHAADIAFRDGKNWHGHDLHFAWVDVTCESSSVSKEHQHGLVQSASGVPKDVVYGIEGKPSNTVQSIPKS